MKKGKFTEVNKTDFVDNYGNHSANVTFDNGDKGLLTFKPDNLPQVGDEFEYEVEKKTAQSGKEWTKIKKYQKPYTGGGGGSRKITLAFTDIKRMCKSNAINALATVNNHYKEVKFKSETLKTILEFTMGGITDDIDKFGEDDSRLTSRLSAMNLASSMVVTDEYETVEELVSTAEKLYTYITG